MKKLEAVIKPYHLEDVKDALQQLGIIGMTISEIRRFTNLGRHLTPTTDYSRSIPVDVDFAPCLKVELVLVGSSVDIAIKAIENASMGQCSIVLQEINDVVRIRTNERGEVAV